MIKKTTLKNYDASEMIRRTSENILQGFVIPTFLEYRNIAVKDRVFTNLCKFPQVKCIAFPKILKPFSRLC